MLSTSEREMFARRRAARLATAADRDDLEQEARIALWQAEQQFDPARCCQFTTYARAVVDGALRHYLRDRRPGFRIPRSSWKLHSRIGRARTLQMHLLGRHPTEVEIADYLGVAEEEVAEAMSAYSSMHPTSLDALTDGVGEMSAPLNESLGAMDPQIQSADLRLVVSQALDLLPEDQRMVVMGLYMHRLSGRQIARRSGISLERVLRLERRAVKLLQRELHEAIEPEAAGHALGTQKMGAAYAS